MPPAGKEAFWGGCSARVAPASLLALCPAWRWGPQEGVVPHVWEGQCPEECSRMEGEWFLRLCPQRKRLASSYLNSPLFLTARGEW